MAFDVKKFLERFVEEAREQVASLSEGILGLEKNPDDAETLNAIFRSAHTLKGSSRMMKLAPITEVAHKMEDVLGALRERKIQYSRELGDLLLRGLDTVSELIAKVERGQELSIDIRALCDTLASAASGAFAASAIEAETRGVSDTRPSAGPKEATSHEPKSRGQADTFRIKTEKLDELIKLMGEIVSNQNRAKQRLTEAKEISRVLKKHLETLADPADKPSRLTGQTLALDMKRLVSEMRDDSTFQGLRMTELQEKALQLRMVPLSTVFDPIGRMVRDISGAIGKEVEFSVEGGEIEIDRKIIEKLSDPLLHLVRNSLDHGIEPTEERLKTGKPKSGAVKISAWYDAGSVLIEVGDDGAGISLEKIKDRALRKKMYSGETVSSMTQSELIDLIFEPGFSTSSIITDVSGRGVGMDIVKKNIVEDLTGSIYTETVDGKGTVFRMRLPLTLAVMRVMFVVVSGIPFAINGHYVSEILKIPADEIITVINKKAIRLREEFIPVVSLGSVFKLSENGPGSKSPLIVIVHSGEEKLGLIVDELRDEESVVIKPLPVHMSGVKMVSGVTLGGKSEIINVVHVPALFAATREMKELRPSKTGAAEGRRIVTILVVDDSVNTREIEKGILEAYGYRVDIATDGVDALEKTRDQAYDLVITDVEMPRMDGFSLTEKLRSTESYRETPIIIVTSREKEADKRRGIAVGANAYIVKGAFDQTSLLEVVQNLVV